AQVIVCLSEGGRFGARTAWTDRLCRVNQLPRIGDFDGDRKDDIAVFVRDTVNDASRGGVQIALSQGPYKFGAPTPYLPGFCAAGQTPLVGDFNGDRRADLIVFVKDAPLRRDAGNPLVIGPRGDKEAKAMAQSAGNVFVALNGKGGFQPPTLWAPNFCRGQEVPKVADCNGDGKDDILTFVRGSEGTVWVALSNGSGFDEPRVWASGFACGGILPEVGQVNQDKFADLIGFTRNALQRDDAADVVVALNQQLPLPAHFGQAVKRHDWFCAARETPLVGDFNGDDRDDVVTLIGDTKPEPALGDAYVALSSFGDAREWKLRLSSLYCFSHDEAPLIGADGDEPYFAVVAFRSRFSTPGSTRVWVANRMYEWITNVTRQDGGDSHPIPEDNGAVTFPNIQAFTIADGLRLQKPEVFGAVYLCLEHDNSSFGMIQELVQRVADQAIAPAIRNMVESRPIPMTPEAVNEIIATGQNSINNMASSIQPSGWDIVRALWDGGGDADDLVNYHLFLYLAVDPELRQYMASTPQLPQNVHFGLLEEANYYGHASPRFDTGARFTGSNTLDSHAAKCDYSCSGDFKLLPRP
ncbi:MAG: VCBS repeat-containing protein, partial [Armatimonadia bacterium]